MNIDVMRKIVERGMPPEPCEAQPGPHVRGLMAMASCYMEKEGQQPTAEILVGFLAQLLDQYKWEESCEMYRQIKGALEQTTSRIVLPK